MRGLIPISPKKRAPRNAKNKRGRGFDCPVKLGETYEVDIETMSPNGEGVATIKGFSVFVAKAQLDQHLKIKITRIDSMIADAEITQ